MMTANINKWGIAKIKHIQNYRMHIQNILIGHQYIHKTKHLNKKIYLIVLNWEQKVTATVMQIKKM